MVRCSANISNKYASKVGEVNIAYTRRPLRGTLSRERWRTLKNPQADKIIRSPTLQCCSWSQLPRDVNPQSINQTKLNNKLLVMGTALAVWL